MLTEKYSLFIQMRQKHDSGSPRLNVLQKKEIEGDNGMSIQHVRMLFFVPNTSGRKLYIY
jgi:hypothetical protein